MKLTFEDKRVLVLGLGDTGLSALRWLRGQGALVSVADTREAPGNATAVQAEMPEVNVRLGAFDSGVFADAEIIVASPGVATNGPMAEPQIQDAVRRGIPVIGDVEIFAQYRPAGAKVIAVTGANGKSTVTTLVGEMCKAAGLHTVVAGNIGLPVLDTLATTAEPDIYILELSSFQLETTSSLQADAATVINISEDHMDRYSGMAEYAAAKARIFIHADVQVLNRQDALSMGMAKPQCRPVTFGTDIAPAPEDFGLLHEGADVWLMHGDTRLLKTSDMHIAGLHNASNALAALALCHAVGLDLAPLLDALRSYKGLPHRVEWVAEINGVAFYDDSKGTNVGATVAALEGLPQKVVLIAGGDGKGQDFSPLTAAVTGNARAVVLIGRDAPQICAVLKGSDIPLITAPTLESAVKLAFEAAHPGDAVLLSPACASFDMFRNYVHRAEVFVSAVKSLEPTVRVAT
jgi:UDP-N-acetylmuramoylalanine--D-glutamate ligase